MIIDKAKEMLRKRELSSMLTNRECHIYEGLTKFGTQNSQLFKTIQALDNSKTSDEDELKNIQNKSKLRLKALRKKIVSKNR